MLKSEAAAILSGASSSDTKEAISPTNVHITSGEVVSDSVEGQVYVAMDGLVYSEDNMQYVEMDTTGGLKEGDIVTILLTGDDRKGKTPLVIGGVGTIDRVAVAAQEANEIATATNQHFWTNTNGVHVTDDEQTTWEEEYAKTDHGRLAHPTDEIPWHNILMNSRGILLRRGLLDLMSLSKNALAFYDGLGNAETNINAVFGSTGAQIGKSTGQHVVLDATGLSAYDGNGSYIPINGEIDGVNIKDSTIEGSAIKDSTIEGSKIASSTIEGSNIDFSTFQNGVIKGSAIEDSTITGSKIASSTIEGSNIDFSTFQNGVIEGSAIKNSSIEGSKINFSTFDSGVINGSAIQNSTISWSGINQSTITASSISGSWIDSSTLTNIPYASIKDADIAVARVANAQIASATIQLAQIQDLYANYAHVTNGVIDNAKIGYADVNNLSAHYAEIQNGHINSALIDTAAIVDEQVFTVTGNKATISEINADKITVRNLNAKNLTIDTADGYVTIGNKKTPTKEYIDSLKDELQQEIDGAVETWTSTAVPLMTNYPTTEWQISGSTEEEQRKAYAKHVGDICYVQQQGSDYDGFCYRFSYNNGEFSWVLIKDSSVTKALGDISDLQTFQSDTASWIEETDEGLVTIRQNHTNLSGVVAGVKTTADAALPTATFTNFEQTTFKNVVDTVDEQSTTITQLSKKTETLVNPNLSPWFSMVPYRLNAEYSGNYWQQTSENRYMNGVTPLEDGWAHVSVAASKSIELAIPRIESIEPGDKVTLLIEWRDVTYTGTPNLYARNYPSQCQFHNNSYSCGATDMAGKESGGSKYISMTANSTADGTASWNCCILLAMINDANRTFDGDLRISMYESAVMDIDGVSTVVPYDGPFKPYVPITETVTMTNTVNEVKQTATSNSSTISQLTQTLGTNADGTSKTDDVVHRVSKIDQDLDGITTRVGKTEKYTESLANPNLTPYFSHPADDIYDATENPHGYWHIALNATSGNWTQLEDGWARLTKDQSSSTSAGYGNVRTEVISNLKPNTDYTLMVEARNVTVSGNVYLYGIAKRDNVGQFASTPSRHTITTVSSKIFYQHAKTLADFSGMKESTSGYIQVTAGASIVGDFRFSLYESSVMDVDGTSTIVPYSGPYKPYIDQTLSTRLYSAETSIEQNADSIALRVKTSDYEKDVSVRLRMIRNHWSDATWETHEAAGYTGNYANGNYITSTKTATGFDGRTLKVGDLVIIEGVSNDTSTPHAVTAKVNATPSGATSDINLTTMIATSSAGLQERILSAETSIEQNAEAITLNAKKTESVGNMLYDTDVPTMEKVYAPLERYWSDTGATSVTCSIVHLSDPPEPGIMHAARFVNSGTNTSSTNRALAFYSGSAESNPIPLSVGQRYVASFWARCTSGTGCARFVRREGTSGSSVVAHNPHPANNSCEVLTTEWKRITFEFVHQTAGDPQDRVWFYAWFPASTAGTIELCGFCLQPATYATSAELKVANDQISARVEKSGVIAAINVSSEEVKIEANRVTIDGTTTFGTNSTLAEYVSGEIDGVRTTANAAAPKANAVKRTQRIYYRSSVNTAPTTPSAWVTEKGNKYASNATTASNWSTKATPIASGTGADVTKYLYLWTCEQYELASGSLGYTNVVIDDSATVIDGGRIIANSITATQIDVSTISIGSGQVTGNFTIGKITNLQSTLDAETNARKAIYGTCSTAAGTAAKVVTAANFALYSGATITVKFTNANTATTPTLNVNSTGAKTIKSFKGAALSEAEYKWAASSAIPFVYDGTNWLMQDGGALQAKADAASSASSASSSASTATSKATAASNSASAAATSESNAASSASTASSKATAASNSATAAASSASSASSSASTATTKASEAASSASTASSKATAAANSATAAANSATTAAEVMGGYTILWNYSDFSTTNDGEGYICKMDPATGTASDAAGWVKWNGTKRTIPRGIVNPNALHPYGTISYVVCHLANATDTTGANYIVTYNETANKWVAGTASAGAIADWDWNYSKDIVLGSYCENGSELAFTNCEVYNPPLNARQVIEKPLVNYYITQNGTSGITIHNANNTNDYLNLTSNSLNIYQRGTSIANFGNSGNATAGYFASARLGFSDSARLVLQAPTYNSDNTVNAHGYIRFYDHDNREAVRINDRGMYVYGKVGGTNVQVAFIGNSGTTDTANPQVILGRVAANYQNILITNNALNFRTNTTTHSYIKADEIKLGTTSTDILMSGSLKIHAQDNQYVTLGIPDTTSAGEAYLSSILILDQFVQIDGGTFYNDDYPSGSKLTLNYNDAYVAGGRAYYETAGTSLTPELLYNNLSTATTVNSITLKETAANFEALLIFFKDSDNHYDSLIVPEPNGKVVSLQVAWYGNVSGTNKGIVERVRWVSISGKTLSTPAMSSSDSTLRNGQEQLYGSSYATQTNYISVVKVLGYRKFLVPYEA